MLAADIATGEQPDSENKKKTNSESLNKFNYGRCG